MDARAGFYALAVSAALVMASGVLSDDAMAQADDATVQGDATSVRTDEAAAPADDVAAEADETPAENDVAAVQDEVAEQPIPRQKPAVAKRPAKSDLNQSAVRSAPVSSSPRPTRTSTRAIALPKILGSYR